MRAVDLTPRVLTEWRALPLGKPAGADALTSLNSTGNNCFSGSKSRRKKSLTEHSSNLMCFLCITEPQFRKMLRIAGQGWAIWGISELSLNKPRSQCRSTGRFWDRLSCPIRTQPSNPCLEPKQRSIFSHGTPPHIWFWRRIQSREGASNP